MCETLDISQRTYYRNRNKVTYDDKEASLIYKVFNDSFKTYGYRRIKEEIKNEYGIVMNKKKVARIMHKYNIMPQYARKRRNKASRQRIEANVRPNIVNRKFDVTEPNKVWVTDITYLQFKGKTWYLSTIIDLYDRSIVSYKIHFLNNLDLVIDTLRWAILSHYDVKNVIIHSDQGFQYTSFEYQTMCRNFNFQISMSKKGTPLDNAVIESYHSRLKVETIYNNDIKSMEELKSLVIDWLEFYDTKRLKNRYNFYKKQCN